MLLLYTASVPHENSENVRNFNVNVYTFHFLLNTNLHYNVPLKFPSVMQKYASAHDIGLTGCKLGMTVLASPNAEHSFSYNTCV